MINAQTIYTAFSATTVAEFLNILFPDSWKGVVARILETGAEFQEGADWAPQWGRIPLTIKTGPTSLTAQLKACIYRTHDCLHQLWGLPIPSIQYTEEDYYHYKRVQICGEVAVLTLTEFLFAKHLYDNASQEIRDILLTRNALPMMLPGGPLSGKNILEIALRMDELLHKKIQPKWVRDNINALSFCQDYVPMLEYDRNVIDANWDRMKSDNWQPGNVPQTKFRDDLTGLELTSWMITDFLHLCLTNPKVDEGLADYNRQRRSFIIFPKNWNNVLFDKDII